ncbi:hypothetical protein GQ53DRAFT_791827 [Thozetella sp. PMI_491]|nr:hypothetical protein GQ53DRAFT_791827 [Thozetella sp. PMI_491]
MERPASQSPARRAGIRLGFRHPEWRGRRKAFILPQIMMSMLTLLLVLAVISYFFGSAFKQRSRVKGLKILAVDYDDGAIGDSISKAYSYLQSDSFPTIEFRSTPEFPDPASIRDAVCRGDYWAGVYSEKGASDRLEEALAGGAIASEYNASSAATYIYNQARYPTVADGQIVSSVQQLLGAVRASYYQSPEGMAAASSLNNSDQQAVAAYLNPIGATANIIQPTIQGSRVFYNTVYMVVPILAQFFLIMAMNGISMQNQVFVRGSIRDVWLLRFAIGKVYSFLCALVLAGCLWEYREGWPVDGRAFVLTWIVLWLNNEVHWVVMESVIASYIPMQFISFFVLSWILLNVSSTVFPFELSPGFYRWGYAVPAHETYSLLIYVWSGCVNPLRVALPVMFSWLILGHVVAWFSIRKRCLDAEKMD